MNITLLARSHRSWAFTFGIGGQIELTVRCMIQGVAWFNTTAFALLPPPVLV